MNSTLSFVKYEGDVNIMEELIELLQEDSRLEPEQISLMLDIPVEEVKKRIAEIEEKKVIVRYGATVDWEKTDREIVSALIEVQVVPQRGVGFNDVARRIYLFPEVRSLYLMSGSYDLMLEVRGRNLKEIANFVAEKLSTIEFIKGTRTNFLLKRYKEDGVIFAEEEKIERLKVTP